MFVVTVTFRLKPGHEAEFLKIMRENARASLANEPGCRRFDICLDPDDPTVVFLYELYDDAAAFDAHQGMPHFAATGEAAGPLTAEKTVRCFVRDAP